MKATLKLQNMIANGEMVVAIGAHDALSAVLVERAGFNAVYVGSYATEATFLGKPDLALMSKTERLMICRNIAKAVTVPVIADMEEGYGTAISVMDAIRDFEAVGLAGVHIDDEDLPSKCPFLPGIPRNQLISVDEMCGKIRAATDARLDPNFKIIARSDVIGTVPLEEYYREGMMEEVVSRSKAYSDAGADAIFVMALSVEELEYFADRIDAPLVGIFATIEPIPIREFEKVGCQMVIGSLVSLYMAGRGLVDGLKALKETGDWNAVQDKMINDREFFNIVGLDSYRPLYEHYKIR
jgi:2-methylisocitrate lyase-like PEP mutase family enzyme